MKVTGVIENMAHPFVAPDTGTEYRIFGEGGGQLLAVELDTELLGSLPIDQRVREGSDAGVPVVLGHPDAPVSTRYRDIAQKLVARKPKSTLIGKPLPMSF